LYGGGWPLLKCFKVSPSEKIHEMTGQRFLKSDRLQAINEVVGFPELSMMLGVEGL
jgi:hypothetical protein